MHYQEKQKEGLAIGNRKEAHDHKPLFCLNIKAKMYPCLEIRKKKTAQKEVKTEEEVQQGRQSVMKKNYRNKKP